MIDLDQVYNEDCRDTMGRIDSNSINMILTSPPYDNLRTYTGFRFDFELDFKPIAKECYRVLIDGGVMVWVVADQTINGSESLTSFKHALYFKEECGFKIDTMIWKKQTFTDTGSLKVRYPNVFEYMFILIKGNRYIFNPIMDRQTRGDFTKKHGSIRLKNGITKKQSSIGKLNDNKLAQRFNVWEIDTEILNNNRFHPAQFPEKIARDHIYTWSNLGDIVYDPFAGSGTVAKMAILMNRRWIASEISAKYCDIIRNRIKGYEYHPELPL